MQPMKDCNVDLQNRDIAVCEGYFRQSNVPCSLVSRFGLHFSPVVRLTDIKIINCGEGTDSSAIKNTTLSRLISQSPVALPVVMRRAVYSAIDNSIPPSKQECPRLQVVLAAFKTGKQYSVCDF
uniref:Uncharacterized protein n=1 Tax=Mesocestoides corti TaxID=53468 RepID=A0A5K3FJK8_MESCO